MSTGHSRHPSPTPSSISFVQLSSRVLLSTSGHAEISSPKPFVWFRAKGIVCLADLLHSVTYGHLPPITKTIQVRRTRYAGHCWRSRDELISDVLLWTPTYGRAKAGQPARTYIQQLREDTGCSPEDLPEAMNDREKRRERVKDIRACGTT